MKQIPIGAEEFIALGHYLPNIECFASQSVSSIDRLIRSIHMVSCEAGEYIFHEGEPGDAFFIIYKGTVQVCRKKYFWFPQTVKATLKDGQFFGEMALLDNHLRSFSIRVKKPTRLFVLLRSAFDLLCRENPSFRDEVSLVAEKRKYQNLHGQ